MLNTVLGYAALVLLFLAGRKGLAVLAEHMVADRALRARRLDIEERAVAIAETKQKSPAVPKSIPSDLYRRIMKWGDEDSQNAERKVVMDLYDEFRDAPDPWSEVRRHLPAEPREDMPPEMFTGMLQS